MRNSGDLRPRALLPAPGRSKSVNGLSEPRHVEANSSSHGKLTVTLYRGYGEERTGPWVYGGRCDGTKSWQKAQGGRYGLVGGAWQALIPQHFVMV
jgi:hypothetical protein